MTRKNCLSASRQALRAWTLRTVLALLALSVGVAAVVAVAALAKGAEDEAVKRVEDMGSNLLVVQAGRVPPRPGRPRQEPLETSLTLDDAGAVEALPRVRAAAPTVEAVLPVKRLDTTTRTAILGTTASYPDVCNSPLRAGRPFTEDEERTAARVAILGAQAARNLFPGEDAIDATLRLRGIPFVVVGVLREKGGQADGANEDDKILVPIKTAMRRLLNTDHIKAVFVSVQRTEEMGRAEREMAAVLRDRHRLERLGRGDDFTIQSQATALAAALATSRSFASLGLAVGAASLGLGGVGVLSMMLLSVKARTGEIGLRMAVGSRPSDILAQFLIEAMLIGLAGGLMGSVLGAIAARTIARVTGWPAFVEPGAALTAIAVSIGVSLVFGAYPARRAASLDPVVALSGK